MEFDPLLPPPLPEALRIASLQRPTVAYSSRSPRGLHHNGHAASSSPAPAAPTVISVYAGHDASVAVGRGGKILCVLELERLFEKRYYESIPLLEKCLEVFEKELPPESSHTVRAMARLMADYKSDSSRASRVATASTTHSPAQGCS